MNSTPNIPPCLGHEVERDGKKVRLTRLNVGCGMSLFRDCVNLDMDEESGADVIFNVDHASTLPFPDNTFDSVWCSHLIEHLFNPLHFMEELHRVCAPGAAAIFKMPYGSSDNAWEDPTHVRPYFLDSFGYFSQAAYGGADYGYRGDWTIVSRELLIRGGLGLEELSDRLPELLAIVHGNRNIVEEMKVVVRCVKPIRSPSDAKEAAPITFAFHSPKPAANDATPQVPS